MNGDGSLVGQAGSQVRFSFMREEALSMSGAGGQMSILEDRGIRTSKIRIRSLRVRTPVESNQ